MNTKPIVASSSLLSVLRLYGEIHIPHAKKLRSSTMSHPRQIVASKHDGASTKRFPFSKDGLEEALNWVQSNENR